MHPLLTSSAACPTGHIILFSNLQSVMFMENLIKLLHCIYPMSPELAAHLRSKIKLFRYRKGEMILREGAICNHIFYIEKGLVRSYYILNGKDVSNWFMKEGDIYISVLSFLRRIASTDNIIALEDSEFWGITHTELEETYRLFPEFHNHGRLITGEYYCRSEERHQAILRQKPEDKYDRLMQTDPDLVQRISNKHLASFLNVGDRTFSLIRKAYKEKGKKHLE